MDTKTPSSEGSTAMEERGPGEHKTNRLIHFLEYEVSSLRSEASRPGWTTWAILGAIASSVWLLLAALEVETTVSWYHVWFLFLLFSVSLDLVSIFALYLTRKGGSKSLTPRFERTDVSFALDRPYAVGLLLRAVILLIILWRLSQDLGLTVILSAGFFFSFRLLETGTVLGLSFAHLPVPRSLSGRVLYSVHASNFLWSGSGILAAIVLCRMLIGRLISPTVAEWRLALLLLAISVLLLVLSKVREDTQLLRHLDEIRRQLCLGKIDLESAIPRVDLALHGLTVDAVLRPDVGSILQALNAAELALDAFISEVSILDRLIGEAKGEVTDETKTTIDAIFRSSISRLEQTTAAIDKAEQVYLSSGLRTRLAFIKRMAPQTASHVELIIEEVKDGILKVKNKVKISEAKQEDLGRKLPSTSARGSDGPSSRVSPPTDP